MADRRIIEIAPGGAAAPAREREPGEDDDRIDEAPHIPMAQRPCDVAALRTRQSLRLVPLADLPEGQGWGERMDELTGGGLAPGDLVGIGAGDTGAGKTALLAQLLDGLALRSALVADDPRATAPLTPVMLVTEMDATDLECRTLGRLLAVAGTMFTAGESATRWHDRATVAARYDDAAALMAPGGAYARLCRWQHVMRAGSLAGPTLVRGIEAHADEWLTQIRRDHPRRQVVPVLALDPVNSVLPTDEGRNEVEQLGDMAGLLDEFAERRGWIVLTTSETNKTSARGDDQPTKAAAVYRGSMQYLHRCDIALVLSADGIGPDGVRPAKIILDKNRRGPNRVAVPYRWHVTRGLRYVPADPVATRDESSRATEQLGRLYGVVERTLTVRPALSPSWLRDHAASDLGIRAREVEPLVAAALAAGVLRERTRTDRGITLALGTDPRPSLSESAGEGAA